MRHTSDHDLLLPTDDSTSSRRDFLQLVGFGIAGASLAGCSRGPVQHAIPALAASREFTPGRAYWIASTCGGCEAGCGALVKCRDGRPIKLEGTPGHPVSTGGLCAAGQGSLLGLYDSYRFDGPRRGQDEAVSWAQADQELGVVLEQVRASGGRVRLLTGTINSPSTRAGIDRFLSGFADARHFVYDPLSASAALDAHALTHGQRMLPRHRFERARTIVSFDADFLATWISPVEFTAGYTAARRLDPQAPRMSRHFQLEARTSLTGSRADRRLRLAPWEVGSALSGLCDLLEQRAGRSGPCSGAAVSAPHGHALEAIAEELWRTRGESLVLAGADEVEVQVLANYANHLLGNAGTTLDFDHPSQQRLGDDAGLAELEAELAGDGVDLLVIQGVNPAFDLGERLDLAGARVLVTCSGAPDETTRHADWILPEPHFLEAWNDAEPYRGTFVLSQPTVPVLRRGRTLRELLARWTGDERSDRELLRAHWSESLWPGTGKFDAFFDGVLEAGFVELEPNGLAAPEFHAQSVRPLPVGAAPVAGGLELVTYPKAGVLDGRHAHNPWLQELPDPVSKITWDNYACVAPATAARLELAEGQVVRVAAAAGPSIELPVHVQRGQHEGVVAVAVGYGRVGTDRFAKVGPEWIEGRSTVQRGGTIGSNIAPLVGAGAVTLSATGASVALAATQDYHSLTVPEHLAVEGHEQRPHIPSSTFEEWLEHPAGALHQHPEPMGDLWSDDHAGPTTWGLAIDLARCTGCSACVVSCQAENNVAVVGRDEVERHREMSWLRIDRYFEGDEDELRALHQPMLCQHCDHAPCESVCPVLATVHSSEGLNQQVYNRCVGTRYCANTCPYKVRRFNWFNYAREDELQNHSLNPDVTVRTRGVMEKCSFCVQRIQEAKGEAKREGRGLRDGDITPACQQSCPADAMVFGDLRDPQSRVARLAAEPRAYGVLEELNLRPSVRYLAHVHNGDSAGGQTGDKHGH